MNNYIIIEPEVNMVPFNEIQLGQFFRRTDAPRTIYKKCQLLWHVRDNCGELLNANNGCIPNALDMNDNNIYHMPNNEVFQVMALVEPIKFQ